jgi:transposase
MPPFGWQKGGAKISKAGKFKSSKITALCNEQGESDHKAVLSILPQIPKQVYVTADRGYDSKKLRRKIRYQGSKPVIPRRQMSQKIHRRTRKPEIYKSRWIVEQAFSRTDQFKKLIVRTERDPNNYKQYWYLGLAWLELKKLMG